MEGITNSRLSTKPGEPYYPLAADSEQELHQATDLLHQAAALLRRSAEREGSRYPSWAEQHTWALEDCAEA